MPAINTILLVMCSVILAVIILILPLKLAAAAMGAQRTGAGWCFISLLAASILQTIGLSVPVYGTLVAFLLSAAAFAGILGTGFLRGIGIAVLYMIFSVIILYILAALFGLSVSGLIM